MPSMYDIYRNHAAEYDRLVLAEDYLGNLSKTLHGLIDWHGRSVLEAGTGTGRVTALFVDDVESVVCADRERHMLEAARRRLTTVEARFVVAEFARECRTDVA